MSEDYPSWYYEHLASLQREYGADAIRAITEREGIREKYESYIASKAAQEAGKSTYWRDVVRSYSPELAVKVEASRYAEKRLSEGASFAQVKREVEERFPVTFEYKPAREAQELNVRTLALMEEREKEKEGEVDVEKLRSMSFLKGSEKVEYLKMGFELPGITTFDPFLIFAGAVAGKEELIKTQEERYKQLTSESERLQSIQEKIESKKRLIETRGEELTRKAETGEVTQQEIEAYRKAVDELNAEIEQYNKQVEAYEQKRTEFERYGWLAGHLREEEPKKISPAAYAFSLGAPVPGLFAPVLSFFGVRGDTKRAEQYERYEQILEEMSPVFAFGKSVERGSEWLAEQSLQAIRDGLKPSLEIIKVPLGGAGLVVAGFGSIGAGGLKTIALTALPTALPTPFIAAAKAGVPEAAPFSVVYEPISFATDVFTAIGIGRAVSAGSRAGAKAMRNISSEIAPRLPSVPQVSKAIKAFDTRVMEPLKKAIVGETRAVAYFEQFRVGEGAASPEWFSILTVKSPTLKAVIGETSPVAIPFERQTVRTAAGEISAIARRGLREGMQTSGIALKHELQHFAVPYRLTSLVVRGEEFGGRLIGMQRSHAFLPRGFIDVRDVARKIGDIRLQYKAFETGVRPVITPIVRAKTTKGKLIAYPFEFSLREGELVSVPTVRIFGRRFLKQFDVVMTPVKIGEEKYLIGLKSAVKISPLLPVKAEKRFIAVKAAEPAGYKLSARFPRTWHYTTRTAEYEQLEQEIRKFTAAMSSLPHAEKKLPASIKLMVEERMKARPVEKVMLPKEGLMLAAREMGVEKQVQKILGIPKQSAVLKLKPKPKTILLPAMYQRSMQMSGLMFVAKMDQIQRGSLKAVAKMDQKLRNLILPVSGAAATIGIKTEIKPKTLTPQKPIQLVEPPKLTTPVEPLSPVFAPAGAVKGGVPPFLPPFGGGDRRLKGLWLKEKLIDEKKLIKSLMISGGKKHVSRSRKKKKR